MSTQQEDEPPTAPGHAESSHEPMPAHIIYGLHAAAMAVGVTAIAGLVVAHIYLPGAYGTWLESHNRWQIRTFWYAVLMVVAGLVVSLGSPFVGALVYTAAAIWFVYRVVRGWVLLGRGQAIPNVY